MAKKNWKTPGDNLVVGGRPTDIVIPVMGPTGVGKSTFINTLLGKDTTGMLVGHGHRVIIVDTPGFDDTYVDDVEILRRIAVWLASSYEANMILGGVIYLLSIADKVNSTTLKNFDMFHRLCGDEALSKVVLGTTKWGEVDEGKGKARERELSKTIWSPLIASGSKMLRFDNTEPSARAFLDTILSQLKFGGNKEILNDNVLRIQKEIVDLERRIPETAAGTERGYTLEQLCEFGILTRNDEANFEKATTLLANIQKQIKNDPKIMKSLPVMILLMGEVGAGKSTFINTAAGQTLTKVGHDLNPCTLTVNHFVIQHHKREVVLVDTPGFNHPTIADRDVLKGIVDWMKNECPKNIPFGGIIYLHDLSKNRELREGARMMTPTKLSDHESHRVVLAMANGDSVAAKRRENQLKSSIWRKVQTRQFMNTQDSAWSILDAILGVDPIKLQDIREDLERIYTTMPTQLARMQNLSFFSRLLRFFSL